jgi:hypothetical protein
MTARWPYQFYLRPLSRKKRQLKTNLQPLLFGPELVKLISIDYIEKLNFGTLLNKHSGYHQQ